MRDRIYNPAESAEDRAERLMTRALDGEITPAERNELETLMDADPAIASMFQNYRRIDALASDALHADFQGAADAFQTQADQRYPLRIRDHVWSRHVRVGLATALLAAAAVIVIASLPFGVTDSSGVASHSGGTRDWPKATVNQAPVFVDYQRPVYQPQRLEGDVFQDVIGVRGDNPNVIIILERLTRQSRVDAVSGEI